ncbi:MAG: hypothetical protein B7Y48_03770 [Methylophilales bacterium 28-44-11]|nr:MAG: hypothetical protein B7Y48_03770 [Methylophilales bacterium 28-44-11]
MSPYVIFGSLTQLKGKTKTTLGKLTGNPSLEASGQQDVLAGKLQAKYTLSIEETETIKEWNFFNGLF